MEIYTIPLDDKEHYIIYRPLIGLAFIGNKAMADLCLKCRQLLPYDKFENNNEAAVAFLSDIGFFNPDIQPPNNSDHILDTAVLLLTNQCQLRCTYCYAAAGDFTTNSLTIESGVIVIDYIYEQAKAHNLKSYNVDFHGGGEPSLEWQTLKYLTKYAKSKNIPVNISLTSNLIWSEQQLHWVVNNIDRLSVSMDGTPETQNRQRPFQNKSPSFSTVMKNLQRLDEIGFFYGIRLTACHPWEHLSSDVKFICENTKCRSFQVEPAFNILRGSHSQPELKEYEKFAIAFSEAYDVAKQSNANLSYSGARPGTITRIFCTAPYNALVINPENNIVACYEIVNSSHPLASISTFGEVKDGNVLLDESKRQSFYSILRERTESVCRDCFCKWSCAGDCYTRAFDESGNHVVFGSRCKLNREITKNIILSLISQQNGVWHGFVPNCKTEVR